MSALKLEQLESRLYLAGDGCALVAFPGAEGFGRCAEGGRGGDVYHVTNLNDTGPGSFREGINTADGPRTVVFDIGGTIFLQSAFVINRPYITIAGETAPGDGITLAGARFQIQDTHDVVVRFIRSRPGDIAGATNSPGSRDALSVYRATDIILDHVSGSWSVDEVSQSFDAGDVTVQWSLLAEGLRDSFHPSGWHSNGGLYVDGNLTAHHNLFVHNFSRNPTVRQRGDVVNNVVFNFGSPSTIGGGEQDGPTQVNIEGNYFIAGQDTSSGTVHFKRMVRLFEEAEIWTRANFVDFNRNGIVDGVLATDENIEFHDSNARFEGAISPDRFDYPRVTTTDANTAYDQVLRSAGASLVRDAIDVRLVDAVMNQTGQVIDSQDEVGEWPELALGETPLDTDQDGMPNVWEVDNGLDPLDPEDRNLDDDGNGYTELEEYLHALAAGYQLPPAITLASPNGGEVLEAGSMLDITWESSSLDVVTVDLYYSLTGPAGPYLPISLGEPNDGLFSWTVPNRPTENAYVRVVAQRGTGVAEDISDHEFAIETPVENADRRGVAVRGLRRSPFVRERGGDPDKLDRASKLRSVDLQNKVRKPRAAEQIRQAGEPTEVFDDVGIKLFRRLATIKRRLLPIDSDNAW